MPKTVKKLLASLVVLLVLAACNQQDAIPATDQVEALSNRNMRINVLLNTAPDARVLADLGKHGRVQDVIASINAVVIQARENQLPTIRALPFVVAANPDAERNAGPITTTAATDFSDGLSTWNLSAINVTDAGGRVAPFNEITGEGVYIAVLDTGLVRQWRDYFPEARIATQYAKAFSGGGQNMGRVSEPPNMWEHDVSSHGTHVTSTILGYSLFGVPINGVAPGATVIPVKVLGQSGSGWSSMVAAGIAYIADLKAGELKDYPVVINMSLGGSRLDALEKAAIDYAISQGVIIVASAGNAGEAGMGYPGAYAPVISVAAAGWVDQWQSGTWWLSNITNPSQDDFYIAPFSSRALAGQELDVVAPGSFIVGPYNINQGQLSYFYLSGTSMASPHVAGIVALMAQENAGLIQSEAEDTLKNTAISMGGGCREVLSPAAVLTEICWGDNATGAGFVDAAAAVEALPAD